MRVTNVVLIVSLSPDLAHPQSAQGRVLEPCELVELGKRCTKLGRKPVADLGLHEIADPQHVSQQRPETKLIGDPVGPRTVQGERATTTTVVSLRQVPVASGGYLVVHPATTMEIGAPSAKAANPNISRDSRMSGRLASCRRSSRIDRRPVGQHLCQQPHLTQGLGAAQDRRQRRVHDAEELEDEVVTFS